MLSICKLRSHALQIFIAIDAFQGHYKDGTEPGTRDCRWFAGIYFLGRILYSIWLFRRLNMLRYDWNNLDFPGNAHDFTTTIQIQQY
jgi:hypothetical protein